MANIKFLALKHKVLNKLQKHLPFIDSDKMIYDFIEKEFDAINKRYTALDYSNEKKLKLSHEQTNENIWIFWWQGLENAPLLVKKCVESVKKNAGGHKVILLTSENWEEYAHIPDYITKKLSEKKITLTHFSDILRMCLLSEYGGLWLDATIFVSHPIPEEYFTRSYFTIHYPNSTSRIAKGKWTGFCQAAKPNQIIHIYCKDVFFSYWKKYDNLIDYFLIDYIMRYGYEHLPQFKALVDDIPENNTGIKKLDAYFNNEYSQEKLKEILSSSIFFKLNWKRKYSLQTKNKKQTVYAYFIESAEL